MLAFVEFDVDGYWIGFDREVDRDGVRGIILTIELELDLLLR
jgi:hypothetical protein